MQKRNPAADIIRCFALFLVISVHFFLNNGYYSQAVQGTEMFIMTVMRQFFIICVPLFIMLSGYLLRKKQLSGKYYKKIGSIILTYVLASIFCLIYSLVFLHQEISFREAIFQILEFSADPYSWYIEMYLGLFLLIPFLNVLYNNLPSQKWKFGLIITFIILTSLPSVINVYNFNALNWWQDPSISFETDKLIPAWWVNIYPLTYYFIGCYLSEYKVNIKKIANVILIIITTLAYGAYTYWRTYKVYFIWGSWCDYTSFFSVILTTLVFVFFININYESFPKKLSFIFEKISGLCLGGYLLSYIFDSIFYPKLIEKVPIMTDRLGYYFLIVPLVYVSSLTLSYILSKIQLLINIIYKKLAALNQKIKEAENSELRTAKDESESK